MAEPMVEALEQDLACENLLDCVSGLKDIDQKCFTTLAKRDEPMTVDDIADVVDRERSTVYRSVQRLHRANVIQKDQINYEEGSYCHVYYPTDPDEIADDMQRTLNDWYAEMSQLIRVFREKYNREVEEPALVEQ